MISNPALDRIRDTVKGTAYEADLWLVGGSVRDDLLGIAHEADFDLVTTEDSQELAALLAPLSSTTPVTYPRFGTAMLRIDDVDIELVTARKESYDEESRKPEVESASLDDDARRRDFTVNTLMRNLASGELLDPTGQGLVDLQSRVLRTPLDPMATFFDDPLRMMRAVRFRWRLGFQPAEGLYEAIKVSKDRLKIVSMERIRDEFVKMLGHPTAPDAMADLMDLGLMETIAPEFLAMVDCEQGKYHHLDVWNHTLLVLRNAGSEDLTLSLSALLHDVGKPPTRTIDENENTRFFGHEALGKEMTQTILRRLKFPQRQIDRVAKLVANHMRLGSATTFSSTAARRVVRDLDDQVEQLLALVEADMNGLKAGVTTMDLDKIRDKIAEVKIVAPKNMLESPLTGEQIMEMTGLVPGREVGRIKHLLTEKVLEGEIQPGDQVAAREVVLSLTSY